MLHVGLRLGLAEVYRFSFYCRAGGAVSTPIADNGSLGRRSSVTTLEMWGTYARSLSFSLSLTREPLTLMVNTLVSWNSSVIVVWKQKGSRRARAHKHRAAPAVSSNVCLAALLSISGSTTPMPRSQITAHPMRRPPPKCGIAGRLKERVRSSACAQKRCDRRGESWCARRPGHRASTYHW